MSRTFRTLFVLAVSITAIGGLSGLSARDARAIGLNTLAVSPTHGRSGSTFQMTYAISPCQTAAGLTIGFSWGALPPAGQVLGTALTDANCRATLSATAPVSTATHTRPAPGTYQVFGYLALPTGDATPGTDVSASYVVDAAPSARGTPTPAATTAHTSSQAATTASSASPAASSSAPSAFALADSSPSSNNRLSSNPLVFHATRLGPWTLIWQLVVGGAALLLLLAGLTLFTIAALRRRRARAASVVPDDKAA